MNVDDKDDEKDPDLAAWLRLWKPPEAPERLRDRLRVSYRSAGPGGLWTRVRGARISLPVPVAALIFAALLVLGILAGRRSSRGFPASAEPHRSEGPERAGLANLRPLPEIQVTILKQGEGIDEPR